MSNFINDLNILLGGILKEMSLKRCRLQDQLKEINDNIQILENLIIELKGRGVPSNETDNPLPAQNPIK